MTFAVIETGSKQYKVAVGARIKIEKIVGDEGTMVELPKVLLVTNDDESDVKIGTPDVVGAVVAAKVLRQARARKIIVFKYHSKTRYRKRKGHRQEFTEIEITGIK